MLNSRNATYYETALHGLMDHPEVYFIRRKTPKTSRHYCSINSVPNDLQDLKKTMNFADDYFVAKNLRVTHSRKHLTRIRNQTGATKSLEYMFNT